jgi:glycosyltransferase involved in cell wall biosynthesis
MHIGIGITTYNRPELLAQTLDEFERFRPPNAKLVVVDDGSDDPMFDTFHFPQSRGVAAAKNKCLELLEDCEHIFLFDDDTYPIVDNWWEPYIESHEPHLMYQFTGGPDHWPITEMGRTDELSWYDKPRGCMLYVESWVVRGTVGGLHVAFGRHGYEHEDWSRRIHTAGLTCYAFADVTTKNFHCMDEDSTNISSLPSEAKQAWRQVDPSRLPLYAEYREQPIPVLIPYRGDNGYRDRLWGYLRDYYWSTLPGYQPWLEEGPEGPFNRSAAINAAAYEAGNWDVAVIADADTWVPPEQLDEAVRLARRTGRLVSALTSVIELSQDYTESLLTGSPGTLSTERVRTLDIETESSMIVVPRVLWERIGGFDEKFVGWGGEDNAFWRAAHLLGGTPLRVDGSAFHLWHDIGDIIERKMNPDYQKNLFRWLTYHDQAKCECSLRRVQHS